MTTIADITKIYVAYFNRAPDPAGLNYWINQKDSGAMSLVAIAKSFAAQTEATDIYGYLSAPNVGSAATFLSAVYLNLFGRVATATTDAVGFAYWTAELATAANVGVVIQHMISGATGDDALVVANKATVGEAFAKKMTDVNATYDAAHVVLAKAAFSGVTSVASTATTATAANDAALVLAGPTGGVTYTLTTSADNLTGGSANDTFNSSLVYDANEATTTTSTLAISDTVLGGTGTDTFNIIVSGAQDGGVTIPPFSVSGVEIFNIRNTVAQTATFAATSGLTTAAADRATGAVTVTGLASGAVAGVIGDTLITNGATSFSWGAAVTSGTVNISGGVTAGAITTAGTLMTSNTVNSTGAANTIGALTVGAAVTSATINATTALTATSLGSTALTTVTVTGAGAVSLGSTALQATVSTLDASAATGALTVALGTLVTQTVTGGSGNDIITSGAVLTTGSVSAGTGTDTLVIGSNVSHVNTASLGAKYTGFETLRLSGTLDVSLVSGLTALQVTDAAVLTNLTATQAAAIQIRSNASDGTGDAQSFALATATGTADVVSLTMGTGLTTSSATDIGALTVTGFETLNIATNAGPTSTAGAGGALDRTTTIASLVGSTLNTINLTGTAVVISNLATTVAVTINGSALTGDGAATSLGLTVAGSAIAASTITGSGVADRFTIGAEGSAYNGGAGADNMTTTTALLVADGTTDGTYNGGDGTDTLTNTTTTTTMTDNHFTKLSNFEVLALTSTGSADHSLTLGGTSNAAYANGLTITTGTLAATYDFTLVGGLSSVNTKITVDATSLTGTATETHSLVTGSGADTVIFTGDAQNVGVTGAAGGTIVISTQAGADTISVTVGTMTTQTTNNFLTITGGTGADLITKVGVNSTTVQSVAQFVMASGDSGTTTATYDQITGYDVATGALLSDVLDFAGTGAVGTLATSTDSGVILSHTLTAGVASFSTATTYASATMINATNLADVVSYLAANTSTLDAIAFLYDSNADAINDATLVYSNQAADSLVLLVGVTGITSLNATTTTATANCAVIA